MSEEQTDKEWLTVKEANALGLANAPRSHPAWSRFTQQLRRQHPLKIRRDAYSHGYQIHRSALVDAVFLALPPLQHGGSSGRRGPAADIRASIAAALPARQDGTRPSDDQLKAALLLLGY